MESRSHQANLRANGAYVQGLGDAVIFIVLLRIRVAVDWQSQREVVDETTLTTVDLKRDLDKGKDKAEISKHRRMTRRRRCLTIHQQIGT